MNRSNRAKNPDRLDVLASNPPYMRESEWCPTAC